MIEKRLVVAKSKGHRGGRGGRVGLAGGSCHVQEAEAPGPQQGTQHCIPCRALSRDGSCVQGNRRKSCVCTVSAESVPSAFCALLLCCSSCCCFAFFIILNTVLLFPLLFTGDSYSYLLIRYLTLDFPSGAVIEKIACQCRNPRRQEFSPWIGKIPWRRKWQPTPVFLPGESHGQRSLAGYGHVVTKSQTQRSMHMTGYFRNLAC